MSGPGQDREELVAAYLLGELDEAGLERFERRLAAEPELRAEVEAMTPVVQRLEALPDEAWEPPEPPPLTLPVTEVPVASVAEPAGPARWSRRRWGAAIAAGVACAAVVAGLWISLDGDENPAAETIVLAPLDSTPQPARGELTLEADGEDRARLSVGGLSASEGDFYEVWLLGRKDRLVSLGSFRVGASGDAEVEIQLPVDTSGYEYFDVSREPDDGDPGHSGDSVLRGPAVS